MGGRVGAWLGGPCLAVFPVAHVSKWLGHRPAVSMQHDARAFPEHFAAAVAGLAERVGGGAGKAAHFAARSVAETGRNPSQPVHTENDHPRETTGFPGMTGILNVCGVGAERFELSTSWSQTRNRGYLTIIPGVRLDGVFR